MTSAEVCSTETSTADLAMSPQHPAQHSVDPVMSQFQVENAAKEKNVHKNPIDESPAMTSAGVSLRKKDEKKRRCERRHNATESNGNHSGVPKDTFLAKTSTAALVMPLQHPAQNYVDPLMRQSQEENATMEKHVLGSASDGSPAMTSAKESSGKNEKRKRRRERRHNAIERSGNLSGVPKDASLTETSTAASAMPPQHPAQNYVDPIVRQSQVENATMEKHVLGSASDGSPAMTSAIESSGKNEKRKRRRERRHNAIERSGNLSGVPKDASLTETSTAELAMPPQYPAQNYVDPIVRQSQVENATMEKHVLGSASDGSPAMTSAIESSGKNEKRKRRRERRHNAIERSGNLSGVPKDASLTETSTAELAMPPQYPAQNYVDPIVRQSQVENATMEKHVLGSASDGSPAMTSAIESSGKNEKRKRRWERRHNAIERSGNLFGVPKDASLTKTSTAALAMPPQHPAQNYVDPIVRQSQVENAAMEKHVIGTASDGSSAMTSAKESSGMNDKWKRRWERRHNAIERSGNLFCVPKDASSTETSIAVLAMPPQHPSLNSLDPVMRQSRVENAAKEKNVLENTTDGSPAMKDKMKRNWERRHNAIESNVDLSGVPEDTFLTETSTVTLALHPQRPDQYSLDPAIRQSLIENATDGSPAMTRAQANFRKENKRRRQAERRFNAVESNGNLSSIPKDTFLAETSRAALAIPHQHQAQYFVDSVTRQSQAENAGKEINGLEGAPDGSPAMINAEVNPRKKNKKRKRKQKPRNNDIDSNIDLFGLPKDNFLAETSTPTLDMPPQHAVHFSMDPVMRHCQEENEGKVQNFIEKDTDRSSALRSGEINSRKKNKKRKRPKTRHNDTECDFNRFEVPKDTISPETYPPPSDMASQYQAPYFMDPVLRQCQEENEGKGHNMIEKSIDRSSAMTSAEVNSRKKNERRKRQKSRHNAIQSNSNFSGVPEGTISTETSTSALDVRSQQPAQFLSLESVTRQSQEDNEGKEQNMLDKGSESSNREHCLEVKNSNPGSVVANAEHFEKEFMSEVVKLNAVQGNVADLGLVTKQDDCPTLSNFSLGRIITSHSKKKLLVLDLNGLLADFVPGVPEGYQPDIKIYTKSVFKRPFCDDFLQFCFDRFHVGIWSSRTGRNVSTAVRFLVGKSASKLLFSWNRYHCTKTKFHTIEDKDKPLVLKELRKLWERLKHGPWEKGDFNESNTLLLDDSPYKALFNPMHTAVFPYSYQYSNRNDTSLGPGGDLRVYLEGLAMAENVQEYVASHPFGQPAITESDPHWHFYRQVIDEVKCSHPKKKKQKNKRKKRKQKQNKKRKGNCGAAPLTHPHSE